MKLHSIDTGYFKLDGGAMFGVVPKTLWNTRNPADDKNLCTWALRCLLIEDGNRLILVDTGIGDKQDEKFFGHYDLQASKSLARALQEKGFSTGDVTDVLLTHLHFDHCGGAISRDQSGKLVPALENAVYWSNENHWNWAVKPNAREKASFLAENILPIQESGQLRFIPHHDWIREQVFPGIDILFVNGHTEAQMLPVIHYKGQKLVYTADLIASAWHVPLAWIMAYDMRPLVTLTEKEKFLNWAVEQDARLIFEHDPVTECCMLESSDKGIRPGEKLLISEL